MPPEKVSILARRLSWPAFAFAPEMIERPPAYSAALPWLRTCACYPTAQNSSGGKDKLGNISKRGDRYLRSLFTVGALTSVRARPKTTRMTPSRTISSICWVPDS